MLRFPFRQLRLYFALSRGAEPVPTKKKRMKQSSPQAAKSTEAAPEGAAASPFAQTYFHGTKAVLQLGDLIQPGHASNYGPQKAARYIFLTATLDAAIWGAELAAGTGAPRIYLVEPTGALEDDPDLTDKKFPGNPTQSYRSTAAFRVVGEVHRWQPHPEEQVALLKQHLLELERQGIRSQNDL